jgi:hypothetical protein
MRISLLLQREPFAHILEKTLQKFLEEQFQREFVVKWHLGKPSRRKIKDHGSWLCNYYLNAIFAPNVERYVLRPAKKEFARSDRAWRTPLNRIYFALATSKPLARHFAGASLEITPALPGAQNLLIIAGNHHIRILDYSRSCCFVIKKDRFSRVFFDKEIKIRKEHDYLPSPQLREISYSSCWYSEDLVIATPINRLQDPSRAEEIVGKVTQPLIRLLKSTASKKNALTYAAGLCDTINDSLTRCNLLDRHEKDAIQQLDRKILQTIRGYCEKVGPEITISQTHGDFQPANILENADGGWLIDWEYTDRRQIAYDGLVLGLNARLPKGLNKRIKHAVEYEDMEDLRLLQEWPHINWQDKDQRCLYLALFLLEELSLKLQENGNPLFEKMGSGFSSFLKEIRQAAEYLQGCKV